ncbi:MAG: metalloregulator ArsR/SmtB family transcription factor [Polyangiaceae bacterium]|jgi:DNA-binding transcriptional ArsR family regulator|nr:metalloregulator ArsR/SmtB family transcription factor [Polyangiaceae bacterium]
MELDLQHPDLATAPSVSQVPRWELYRLLSDPVRVRLLALVDLEELAVGELAELLGEGQPKVSRHAAALRDAGLVAARRNGTWVLLKLAPGVSADPVVSDALAAGRTLLDKEGLAPRVEAIVSARDDRAREYFARGSARSQGSATPRELGAYLTALAPLLFARGLAVDAGTGDGALLDVLAPIFDRVIAVDRAEAQLKAASARARAAGFANVEFVLSELDGREVDKAVHDRSRLGADVVFASRILHHAPKPAAAVTHLAKLLRAPSSGADGGALIVLDYAAHEDQALRDAQADLWLGFTDDELVGFATRAGLERVAVARVPSMFRGDGPDAHLDWRVLSARRGRDQPENETRKTES